MRRLGALARQMLINAASARLDVPAQDLTTEPGRVIHAASGRALTYGELAQAAMDLPVPASDSVTLRTPDSFRWIGKGLKRLDVHAKSTGQAAYSIDQTVDGMLQAAIQHAPRLGLTVGKITNEAQVAAMPGVHSVHILDGAGGKPARRSRRPRLTGPTPVPRGPISAMSRRISPPRALPISWLLRPVTARPTKKTATPWVP
jgi:isoquinoline 1-oxidoreductase beta subunit